MRVDTHNIVTSGTQLWLWQQHPYKVSVQTFCLQEAANQNKSGVALKWEKLKKLDLDSKLTNGPK